MNSDDLGRLMAAWMGSVPRLEHAACRGRTEMADIDIRSPRAMVDASLEICLACRQMQQCSDWVNGLPADQRPRGVCGGRLWDPDAPKMAREMMAAERKAVAPPTMPRPRAPRRPARRLLAAVEAAGPEGITAGSAAAVLYGGDVTTGQRELARQGLERLVRRGALVRLDRGGRARYAPAQIAVAS